MFIMYVIGSSTICLAIWLWGLRPFLRAHGKTSITGAKIGLSMWADWTQTWELGRELGHIPLSAKLFLFLNLTGIILFVGLLLATSLN